MKTIKILHTADWHIGSFKGPEQNGSNLRLEDTIRCLEEMVRVAEQERPELVLVSGDIFHQAEIWQGRSHRELHIARSIIKKLSEVSGEVIVMRGTPNHDAAEIFMSLTDTFERFPNVQVITQPQVIQTEYADIAVVPGFDKGFYRAKFPGLSGEEENVVFTQELSNIVTGLKAQCRPEKISVLMAHYTVPGCNAESGQTMLLTKFEPVIQQETLLAADYDLVALGHIHRPQRVTVNPWYYSGAINANNFNDEGQERGFWIHHFEEGVCGTEGMVLTDSQFFNTPIREFITFNFTDTDITAINLGHMDEVAHNYWRYNNAVKDKIVRILYSCSEENKKALNKTLVQKTLLDDGAFMAEVLPDNNRIFESPNRAELSKETNPEVNLISYLEEKQIAPEKIQELVLKARPIIAAAEASITTSVNTGTFEPVEISVKNYRNYEEETFNFEDITFCTINGQNGAGKSSLFMDAIVDCLFEEPREGVIKDESGKSPWIRNDENARSGSIMFTFRIGEKKYRVTRTRARSGKITLNIAQFVDGEWTDCSKERANDTQQVILDILGMDSFTFKSCALIMQDQYGLFLQARPEERVEVLSTLLGLGIYQSMERIASDKAKVSGTKGRELKQEIEIHNSTISNLGNPDGELELCKTELDEYEKILQSKVAERDKNKLILENQQEAAERRTKLLTSINTLQSKKAATEQNRAGQQAIADSTAIVLNDKNEIEARAGEYRTLLERERELSGESALYSSKKQEAENLAGQEATEQETIETYTERVKQKENELALAQPTDQDTVVKEKVAEYERKKAELDILKEKAVAYQQAKTEHSAAVFHYDETIRKYESEKKVQEERKAALEKKVSILAESGCVDIENAHCRFLQDAIEAKEQLSTMEAQFADIESRKQAEADQIKTEVDTKQKEMQEIGYDANALAVLQSECTALFPYVEQLEAINQRENKIALLEADIKHLRSNIREAENRLADVKIKRIAAEQERDQYAKAFEEHGRVLVSIETLKPWIEREKQLPVSEERHATALRRVLELTEELKNIDQEIAEKQADADKEILAMSGMEELTGIVARMNAEVDSINSLVKEKQMKIGGLQQKAEQITKLKQEIAALQEKQLECAKETADYDVLKVAFSQSGVPHQIIRDIIPQLTATSNTILGQMTGGKMGVEFRLEKKEKSGKEKESLDIFIEEYGKPALPYLSKSGGEKVKASLSVILTLAEIKSTSAGIQLGMLFIDEPPFLDADGIQAYCDALETIQQRYSDIKIMAITHDPTMKARFPQNLDIVKTDHGSKVIC